MKMKNHIHMLTKQLNGLSCEHNPHSQALQGGSTTCNLFVDGTMVESNKVHSPLVKRTRGKPPSRRLVSTVEKNSGEEITKRINRVTQIRKKRDKKKRKKKEGYFCQVV